jgi:5-hydroxyisourate hydrolase-like protein (transthyretin family)
LDVTTTVVSGEGRARVVARPNPRGQLLRKTLCGLSTFLLVMVALALLPLGSVPATAAPPALVVTLTQSSDTSEIGSRLTLTATVTWSGGETTEPTGGWSVEFTGTGDGGWTSGPVPTEDGEASYARSSPVAQTETITARIANAGCTGTSSNEVIHEWWRGEIVITNPNASSDINSDFTLTGQVLRSGQPVTNARVSVVVVALDGGSPTQFPEASTDGNGDFAAPWTSSSSVPAIESVDVTATGAEGFETDTQTTHAWSGDHPAGDRLSLESDDAVRVDDRVLVVGRLLRNGTAIEPDPPLQFLTNLQPPWQPSNVPTEPDRYNYAGRDSAGNGYYGARTSTTGLHVGGVTRWWRPDITFVSPASRSPVSQAYSTTVVVTDRGVPLPGIQLRFTELMGELENDLGPATTDQDGRASVSITRATEQTVDIGVREVGHSERLVSTTHAWVAAPDGFDVSVNLTQASQESRVGTSVQLDAEVLVGARAVEGWDVAFAADDDSFGVRVTNANGVATIISPRYDVESYALFTAAVAIDGCTTQSAEVFHYWWQPDLELNPKATTSPARSDVTFTAALSRSTSSEDTVAVPGQLIRFTITSQNCALPVVVRDDRTNDDGIAAVTFSRDGPSVDSVQAREVGVVGPASDDTTHTWGGPTPPPLSISLAQDRETSRAGTEVILTAIVRDADRTGGRAGAGIPVTFLGLSPTRTVPTDASGVARLTVQGTGTTSTTVTASAPFGCGVVLSTSVTHRWFIPTLELTPATATTTTGDTASVTAVLTDGQNGVAGQKIRLTVDHRARGVDTLTRTETTDGNGAARFTWSRTEAGVDDLTAVELIDVRPQQDTAQHIWEGGPTAPVVTPSSEEPTTPPATIPTGDQTTPTPVEESEPPEETSTPSPTETTNTPPPPTTTPPSDLPATSTLVDGPEVGRPGADIEVSGRGCRAGQSLTVRLGESTLGRTRAAADGTFYLRGVVPDLPLGRYLMRSTCGTTIGDPNVDITAPQVNKAKAGIAAVGVTTASTFVFFLLLAKGVISFLPRRPS